MKQSAFTDRNRIAKADRSVSINSLLEKIPFITNVIWYVCDLVFGLIRALIKKNINGNIAVISLHRLGDTVFTVPAVREIIKYYPERNVKIFCFKESKAIYDLVFNADNVIGIEKKNFMYGLRIANSFARKLLQRYNPSVIYDLTGTVTSASLFFNSKAEKIIGSNQRVFHKIYSGITELRKSPHLIDRYLDIPALNINFKPSPEIYEHKTIINPEGYILIHPLSIRKAKEWNLNKYLKLAEELNKQYVVRIIIPSDTLEQDICTEISQSGIPLLVTQGMKELIEYIRECSLYISNDTGPLYIANLLGKPTFTIYGPTNPSYSLPFGKYHRYTNKLIGCSPVEEQTCFTFAGINCSHYDCMNLLTFDEVYPQAAKFAEELGIRKRISADSR